MRALLDTSVLIADAPPVGAEAALPIWKRFLACFYGAINEELLSRLFALSLFLWLARMIVGEKSARPGTLAFWIANAIGSSLEHGYRVLRKTTRLKTPPLLSRQAVHVLGQNQDFSNRKAPTVSGKGFHCGRDSSNVFTSVPEGMKLKRDPNSRMTWRNTWRYGR